MYDAWILSNNEPRSDFPYETFVNLYPDWDEQRLKQFEEMETERNCKDDSSNQGSEIAIVTDEMESCKQTCSISNNDRLITIFLPNQHIFQLLWKTSTWIWNQIQDLNYLPVPF